MISKPLVSAISCAASQHLWDFKMSMQVTHEIAKNSAGTFSKRCKSKSHQYERFHSHKRGATCHATLICQIAWQAEPVWMGGLVSNVTFILWGLQQKQQGALFLFQETKADRSEPEISQPWSLSRDLECQELPRPTTLSRYLKNILANAAQSISGFSVALINQTERMSSYCVNCRKQYIQ